MLNYDLLCSSSSSSSYFKAVNREKSSRHVVMVATLSWIPTNRGPANMAEKIDLYDSPVHDCTQEQNGSPYASSIVGQC